LGRRCARRNADQTRRRLLEERQDSAALQLDNELASGIASPTASLDRSMK
jgi:hypothetical protein